ncbi:GntR family transcriptional regulator [Bounagaea algeriensis]
MLVEVDPDSSVAPFEQLRAGIAERINDGRLPVGAKLPTVRALAAETGVAANTAARAYRELERAGLLETRGRSGTFVSAAEDTSSRRAAEAAAEYARLVRSLGLGRQQAGDIATAALDAEWGRS